MKPADFVELQRLQQSIYADIPEHLLDTDELLTRYGRWATRGRGGRQCGSAEGNYRTPTREHDAPAVMSMSTPDAMRCQRALQRVAELERQVLAVLYVPNRVPPHVALERMRIPPMISRERHLRGLFMFRNLHRSI